MAKAFTSLLRLPQREHCRILEVGPTQSSVRLLSKNQYIGNSQYVAVDVQLGDHLLGLEPPHLAFEMDVCELEFSEAQFDVVVCNHVLAFVPDFKAAIREILRVLKTSGVAFLQTSLPLEHTVEAETFQQKNPELFTQEVLKNIGTHWLFGRDYFQILRQMGFIPLRYRFGNLEYFMAFKSSRSPFFTELSHLNEANIVTSQALQKSSS